MKHVLLIVWTERQASGIPILDEHRRIIAGILNSLYFLLSNNLFRQGVMNLAKATIHQTQLYTMTEEYLLTQAEYSDFEEHRKLHKHYENELVKAVRKTIDAYDSNAHRCDELLVHMKKYWLEHICKDDQKYIPYVQRYMGIIK